jgi:hypothetical protein
MNKIKAIISFAVMLVGILISGEMYISYISGISTESYVIFSNSDISKLEQTEYAERFKEVEASLKEEGLNYFVTESKMSSDGSIDISVFCTNDVRKELEGKGYKSGNYISILAGKITFNYGTIDEFLTGKNHQTSNKIYVYGKETDKIKNADLSSSLYSEEEISNADLKSNCILVWCIVFFMLLLINAFICHFKKKEWMVNICYGHPLNKILLRELMGTVLTDLIVFFGLLLIFNNYHLIKNFGLTLILIFFIFLLIEIFIIVISVNFIDYKIAFRRAVSSNKLLVLSYCVRVISLCLIIVFASSTISEIATIIPMLAQESFYEKFKGASHISVFPAEEEPDMVDGIGAEMQILNGIYAEKLDEWNIIDWGTNGYGVTTFITANKNSEELLKETIPSLSDYVFEKDKIYFIIPSGKSYMEDCLEDLQEYVKTSLLYFEEDTIKIYYDEDVSTYAFDSMGDNVSSDTIEFDNPVIIFNNYDGLTEEQIQNSPFFPCVTQALFADESEINSLKDEFDIDYIITVNIYDTYQERVALLKKQLMMLILVFILAVGLEIMLLNCIIKMEQSMNSLEICVRKINGTPLRARYEKMTFTMVSAIILGACLSSIIIFIQTEKFSPITIPVALVAGAIEFVVFAVQSAKWEKKQMHTILKGGAL